MLTSLHIKNFVLIDNLELDFKNGLTVLTGETGAGKSIIIDTLELILGGRTQNGILKDDTKKCELSAEFSLDDLKEAKEWLKENDLGEDDDESLIVRRVITPEGKSKSYINGHPVPVKSTSKLAPFFVDIHGQHEHYSLLKVNKQRELLDLFAKNGGLLNEVNESYHQLKTVRSELTALLSATKNIDERLPFLKFQIEELEKLELKEGEVDKLHDEHRELNAAESIVSACNNMLDLVSENEDATALSNIYNAQKELGKISSFHNKIGTAHNLLDEALIPLEAATLEIKNYLNNAELNPERLTWLEDRLNSIYDLARKHKTKPEKLFNTAQNLVNEAETLENSQQNILALQDKVNIAFDKYLKDAEKLSQSRVKAGKKLSKLITDKIKELGMEAGQFSASIIKENNQENFTEFGIDKVEFLLTTIPDKPPLSLSKVASGGELSRISLALEVSIAAQKTTPTLIFDEVDVGIGGKTAEIVGQMLNKIAEKNQIICVTHLPQVAAQGTQHLLVSKISDGNSVSASLKELTTKERISEIARMLGGVKITDKTLAHAQEMVYFYNEEK